jgi:glycosyltransferase involved in cell wall biosynthesis
VTGYTTGLVRDLGLEPADEFPAYMDFDSFLQKPPQPLPAAPRALFVGVLERYKNVDGLAAAWRLAAPRVPGAHLHLVGAGTLQPVVEQLVRDVSAQTSWTERLAQSDVSAALDESTLLVLPSRSEGMGRVLIEAFCRGPSSRAGSAASPTSSRTASTDCSSSLETPPRWQRRSWPCSATLSSRFGLAREPSRAPACGRSHRRSSPPGFAHWSSRLPD